MLVNIKAYDKGTDEERAKLEPAIQSAILTLHNVGVFDLFAPEEWDPDRSPGHSLAGRLAKEYMRKKILQAFKNEEDFTEPTAVADFSI